MKETESKEETLKKYKERLYELKIGEIEYTYTYRITRVPGGWIFHDASDVFVPFIIKNSGDLKL